MIQLTYAGFFFLVVICLAALLLWLRSCVRRLQLSAAETSSLLIQPIGFLVIWLAITAALAQSGFLAVFDSLPPRAAFVPVIGLISVILFSTRKTMRKLLLVTPRHWPVALQSFRIGVELTLWCAFLAGLAPIQTTFEGRNYDVIVGLTAPIIAWLILKKNLRPKAVIAWNVISLLILGNTLVTVLTSVPGPLHLNWAGEPFTAFATWPIIWLPAFLAPLAVGLHVFSIRQNL